MRPSRLTLRLSVIAILALCAPAHAEGDAAAGEKLFRLCRSCHAVEAGKHRVGPSLHGIVGRTAGTAENYTNYSNGLKTAGFQWDAARLDAYLANPKLVIPDSRMTFAGVPGAEDRANIIAYLTALPR